MHSVAVEGAHCSRTSAFYIVIDSSDAALEEPHAPGCNANSDRPLSTLIAIQCNCRTQGSYADGRKGMGGTSEVSTDPEDADVIVPGELAEQPASKPFLIINIDIDRTRHHIFSRVPYVLRVMPIVMSTA